MNKDVVRALRALSAMAVGDKEVKRVLKQAMRDIMDIYEDRKDQAEEEAATAEIATSNLQALAKPYRAYYGPYIYGFDSRADMLSKISGWSKEVRDQVKFSVREDI